jgi:hypothetical protein
MKKKEQICGICVLGRLVDDTSGAMELKGGK